MSTTMRKPTRSKAQSFKGAQALFIFPVESTNESRDSFTSATTSPILNNEKNTTTGDSVSNDFNKEAASEQDNYYLSNHYLINAVASANMLSSGSILKNNHVMKRSSLYGKNTPSKHHHASSSNSNLIRLEHSSKPTSEVSLLTSSNGGSSEYYSFANISDNTTSRSSVCKLPVSSGSDTNSESNEEPYYYSHSHSSSPTRRRMSTNRKRTNPVIKKRNSVKVTRKSTSPERQQTDSRKLLHAKSSQLTMNGNGNTLDPNATAKSVMFFDYSSPSSSDLQKMLSGNKNDIVNNNDLASDNSSIVLNSAVADKSMRHAFAKSPSNFSLSSMSSGPSVLLPVLKTDNLSLSSYVKTPKENNAKTENLTHKFQPNGSVEDDEDEEDDDKGDSMSTINSKKKRHVSSTSHTSSLKRSNAIRCKGGLLHFFIKIGKFTKKSFHQWKLSIQRVFKKKPSKSRSTRVSSMKRSNSMQFKTTNHLKRNFYTNVNIKRSMSTIISRSNSMKKNMSNSLKNTNSNNTTSPVIKNNDTLNLKRKSLRRSPSSIKRAVSIMNNIDSRLESKGGLSSSNGSLKLNSYVLPRPSSGTINCPGFTSNTHREDAIAEESDVESGSLQQTTKPYKHSQLDDYVIDTAKMATYSATGSATGSSESGNSVYEDAVDFTPKATARCFEIEPVDIEYIEDQFNSENDFESEEDMQRPTYDSSSVYSAHNILSEIIEEEEEEEEEVTLQRDVSNSRMNIIKEEKEEESYIQKGTSEVFVKRETLVQTEFLLSEGDSEDSEDSKDSEKTESAQVVDDRVDTEVLSLLMKHFLGQVIQRRISMNLEMASMQRDYEFNEVAQQIVRQVLSDYEGSTEFETNSELEYTTAEASDHDLHSKRSNFSSSSFTSLPHNQNIKRSFTLPISFR